MDIFLDHLTNKFSLDQEIVGLIVGPAYFQPKP